MGLFGRSGRVSGGSGGRGAGRGPVALPARGPAAPVPPYLLAIAPGGQGGPEFPTFGGFYDTLPLPQAAVQDMSAAPSELVYARPRYRNTAGRDRYSAPTAVSWTANAAVGVAASSAHDVESIPVSIKRYDSMTMRREFGHDAQRYPMGGHGWPRVPIQRRAVNRAMAGPSMQPGHTNELTRLPAPSSFGTGTITVGLPDSPEGTGLFG